MWVPRTALLGWVSLVVVPFAILGGVLPASQGLALLVIVGFVLLVVVDAALSRSRLHGVEVLLPELVRLQKDRPGMLELRIHNPSQQAGLLRVGFAFPREIVTDEVERWVRLPAGTPTSTIDWACTPSRRGQYFLSQVFLETGSVLGFWGVRKTVATRSELRVYPNLFQERKQVAALFLKRAAIGLHSQRFAGQGREFEKLREYVHGDSVDHIHWKASAKRGYPVTKVFQVERTQEVYVIVDSSRLTARQVPSEEPNTVNSVLERFVTSALILGLAAEQQGDQFGLITFSDKVLSFVRAKNGQAHYDTCRDRLYALQPQSVTPDFDELCSFIRLRLRKRALLIFLTALDDPMTAEAFTKSLEYVCRQHLVLVDMLKPPAANPLFSEDVRELDEIYHRLGGHLQWQELRELQQVLQRKGVRLSMIDPQHLTAELIAQHADVKARQLL